MQADLIVIGAGPAGMAAAAQAASAGLSVLLLDEQNRAGGQIYRDVERAAGPRGRILGPDYTAGLPLVRGIARDAVSHAAGATVWQVGRDGSVTYTMNGAAAKAKGRRLMIATGALERPVPIPGWTLPGVMTAGAAQILLKQSGVLPRRAVLAGAGPLLYLVAAQMVRAGLPPLALVETQTRDDFRRSLAHVGGALAGWRYLAKGLGLMREIRAAGIARHTGATELAIEGDGRAEALTFRAGDRTHRIACDTVLLHQGVVPNIQIVRSLNLPLRWHDARQCFEPVTDRWGHASDAIHIAGDGAGIGGAVAATLAGRIAALGIAADLGALSQADRDRSAVPLFRALDRERAIRPFLDAAYPPSAQALAPADETVICRCEEVTAGDIRRYARLGCLGPNQAKAFGRAGMGPCQGRYCGLTVTRILADTNGRTPDDTGYFRIRPPLKPVTLGELAALDDGLDDTDTGMDMG